MIIKKEKPQMVEFGELAPGDVFVEMVDGEEIVQMKVKAIQEEDGTNWNCVALDFGTMYYTRPDKKVYRVVAELMIK